MEAYSRDLLRGIGGGDDGEQKVQRLDSQGEEVELSLGLSLGGWFGTERRSGEGLAKSSSVACIQEVALAPPALGKTNSLPTMADAEAGNKQNLGDLRAFLGSAAEVQTSATPQGSGFPLNSIKEEPVAMLRASLCPSPGSSDGQGILTRTSSFPAGIEGGFKKRNLKKLEVKRRIERMKSSKVSVEEVGENLDEMNATAKDEKVENCDDLSMKNEQPGGKPKVERMNHSNVRRRSSGLPPPYKAPGVARMPGFKRQNSTLKGTHSAEGQSLSSALVASSSAPAVRAAALGSGGEQQDASERPATRATRRVGDVREMPLAWTSGLPNGRRAVGFLYEYRKVDEVRIMCVCHGSFLTPAEFVEHAGGGQVANPLRRILVKPPPWL